ncbi:MAG: hypothetical protein WDN04_23680 [Rhodospirillales bacterium]
MNRFVDARIPLVFADAAEAGPDDAVLREGEGAAARAATGSRPGRKRRTRSAARAARRATPRGLRWRACCWRAAAVMDRYSAG